MTPDEEEQLDDLRAAMARMRFVTLPAGILLGLYGLFGGAATLTQLWIVRDAYLNNAALAVQAVVITGSVVGSTTVPMDLVGSALLVGSAVDGLQARTDPELLVQSARRLRRFWWLALARLAVMGLGMAIQTLGPLAL